MNDDQIIKLFFARNEDAIQQTTYKYGARLQSMAVNIVQDTQDAQECVNDTYLKTWDTIPPTKPGHFFAYLAKICRYISFGKLDWKNAAKRKAEVITLLDYQLGDGSIEFYIDLESPQTGESLLGKEMV